MSDELQALLKPAEAAKLLAISLRTLWRMTVSRKLPAVKVGRCVRYSPADLAEYIDRQRTPAERA